ncbi:hypothetical protein [Clostridium intestinale]|nr:hypothetical protein [Clostridium intestinale]
MVKGRKADKSRAAEELVTMEITDDVVQTHTSHTTNKPKPKFQKKS